LIEFSLTRLFESITIIKHTTILSSSLGACDSMAEGASELFESKALNCVFFSTARRIRFCGWFHPYNLYLRFLGLPGVDIIDQAIVNLHLVHGRGNMEKMSA